MGSIRQTRRVGPPPPPTPVDPIDVLRAEADELGVPYRANTGAKRLQQDIEDELARRAADDGAS
jgi:hypothetical protein